MVITAHTVVNRAEKELVARHRHVKNIVGVERVGGAPRGQRLVVGQVVAKHTNVLNGGVEDPANLHHGIGFRDAVKRGHADARGPRSVDPFNDALAAGSKDRPATGAVKHVNITGSERRYGAAVGEGKGAEGTVSHEHVEDVVGAVSNEVKNTVL